MTDSSAAVDGPQPAASPEAARTQRPLVETNGSLLLGVDLYACVVLPATLDAAGLGPHWLPGPLPIPLDVRAARGRSSGAPVADRQARTSYFAPRVAESLYLSNGETGTGRWHALTGHTDAGLAGMRVESWECLFESNADRAGRGYLVAHVALGQDPLGTLFELTRRVGEARDRLISAVPAGVHVVSRDSTYLVSHLVFESGPTPPPLSEHSRQALSRWTVVDQWLWLVTSGVDPESFVPDTEAQKPGTVVPLSSDWRALTLRNGVGYCALTPAEDGPHRLLRQYVRSIHLDGFLLAQLQTDAAQDLADELGRLKVEDLSVSAAMELEQRLLVLRGDLWWRHLSVTGGQVDQVIRAVQDERHLSGLYEQLVGELTDVSRFIGLRQTLADQERDRKTGQVVSLVSATFVTPSIFLAAVALWPEPSPALTITFWVISLVVAVATWRGVNLWIQRVQDDRPTDVAHVGGNREPRRSKSFPFECRR